MAPPHVCLSGASRSIEIRQRVGGHGQPRHLGRLSSRATRIGEIEWEPFQSPAYWMKRRRIARPRADVLTRRSKSLARKGKTLL
jgi:hypothetical protein